MVVRCDLNSNWGSRCCKPSAFTAETSCYSTGLNILGPRSSVFWVVLHSNWACYVSFLSPTIGKCKLEGLVLAYGDTNIIFVGIYAFHKICNLWSYDSIELMSPQLAGVSRITTRCATASTNLSQRPQLKCYTLPNACKKTYKLQSGSPCWKNARKMIKTITRNAQWIERWALNGKSLDSNPGHRSSHWAPHNNPSS